MSLWSILGLAATLVLFVFVMVKPNQLSTSRRKVRPLPSNNWDGIIEMRWDIQSCPGGPSTCTCSLMSRNNLAQFGKC